MCVCVCVRAPDGSSLTDLDGVYRLCVLICTFLFLGI